MADDLARSALRFLLEETAGAPDGLLQVLTAAAALGRVEDQELKEAAAALTALRNKYRELKGKVSDTTYAAVWKVGVQYILAAPQSGPNLPRALPNRLAMGKEPREMDVYVQEIHDDQVGRLFRSARLIQRFRELVRAFDSGSGSRHLCWDPLTRTVVEDGQPSPASPPTLHLHRDLSRHRLFIQLEYDPAAVKVTIRSQRPNAAAGPAQTHPDEHLLVHLTFERVPGAAVPLHLSPVDRDAIVTVLYDIGWGDNHVEGFSRPLGLAEKLEQMGSVAIHHGSVFARGGRYHASYCLKWNAAPLYDRPQEGSKDWPDFYRWLKRMALPDLPNLPEPGPAYDQTVKAAAPILELACAQFRPELYREESKDPPLLRPGTIRVGGLKAYTAYSLIFVVRSADGRLFVISAFDTRTPLGAGGALGPERVAVRALGLLRQERRRELLDRVRRHLRAVAAPSSGAPGGAVAGGPPLWIIVSHPDDKDLRQELMPHLKRWARKHQVEVWHDGETSPGLDTEEVWQSKVAWAQRFLWLVSPSLLSSRGWQTIEKLDPEPRTRSIPILLRPISLEGTFLHGLQSLPKSGHYLGELQAQAERDQKWNEVCDELDEAAAQPAPQRLR